MDVGKLRSAFLRVHYVFLRLIAAAEDVLETHQKVGLIRQLTGAGTAFQYQKLAESRPLAPAVAWTMLILSPCPFPKIPSDLNGSDACHPL
jgi:hypothetical protein